MEILPAIKLTSVKYNKIEKGCVFLPVGKCLCDPKPVILQHFPTETPADFSGILSWSNAGINT